MVQGYTQANTPNPSVWSSNFGNQAGCFRGSSPFQRVSPYRCNHLHESDSKKIDELKTAHEEDARKMDKLISSINDLTAQLKLKNKPVR